MGIAMGVWWRMRMEGGRVGRRLGGGSCGLLRGVRGGCLGSGDWTFGG